jgi:Ca2+:H+ antiporter
MKETSSDPPDIESQRPGAKPKAFGYFRRSHTTRPDGNNLLPLTETSGSKNINTSNIDGINNVNRNGDDQNGGGVKDAPANEKKSQDKLPAGSLPVPSGTLTSAASTQDQGPGAVVETDSNGSEKDKKRKRTIWEETKRSFWMVITHSWINLLLVFVPVGIIVANVGNLSGGIIFAMNSIAIIPLAGLLAHATESVASKMGDSLGALLNVTFGNAVELIIL